MVYRLILPAWALEKNPTLSKVLEGEYSNIDLKKFNDLGYNIYYLPNYPSEYNSEIIMDGSHIDIFEYVYVDMDLKDNIYKSKDDFISILGDFSLPSMIVDSGNGIHAYWKMSDLDVNSYLSLQRRLIAKFNTDPAVSKIFQLMRFPGTYNTKDEFNIKSCECIFSSESIYTCEDLDKILPPITKNDQDYCTQHYNKTYKISSDIVVDNKLPLRFGKFLKDCTEAKDLWVKKQSDRSGADFRLGHLMFAHGFTKDEALSVLVNTQKALTRSPYHRISYAQGIVEKIWTYELSENKDALNLSSTVKEILNKYGDNIKGTRFPCWDYIDATYNGFRLGQVIGLVAGSGVGKTAVALNMFKGFVQNNPDYDHFFIPLEQPVSEIADRWKNMCGLDTHLYEKVHLISNYDDSGAFRHLSFDDIKDYLLKFQNITKRKIGAVVIDHIGALNKKGKNGENQDLMDICHKMKAFAIETNTMLIMQSQAPREKAGIGDLELNKDAAYGTVYFESYCDYLITVWQPLKRCYSEQGCPTVTAFKFCKIRHKKQNYDKIKEDVRYKLIFDSKDEHLREFTETEEVGFDFWLNKATNERKKDRKTDIVPYNSVNNARKLSSN